MDTGYILHAAERTRSGRAELHYFGRLTGGGSFAVLERRRRPFFHVRASDEAAAAPAASSGRGQVLPSPLVAMDGAPLLRVECATVSGLQNLRDALHRTGIRTYEADVRLATQLLMECHVHGGVALDGPWRPGRRVQRIYENPTLGPADVEPALRVLSLDIETDPRGTEVYAVGLACREPGAGETAEVLFSGPPAEGARAFPTEAAMLTALRDRILEIDPDIITGWNIIDFDFRVLAARFAALGVSFDIGRSDQAASFLDREDSDGVTRWRRSRAVVPGRQVLDGMWLVRMAGMGLEDYRLETVAQSVLGRGKKLDERPGEGKAAAVQRLYREDPGSLCAYCLEDTRLVLDILAAEGLLEIAVRKSLLIGTTLEQTSTSVSAFEFLYMEHLHDRGVAAPSLGIDQEALDRAPGGGLITPRAGLFHNVLAFDFKSLYPSLMRTFNLDPLAHARADADPSPLTAPNGARFSREPGILPGILDRFFESREQARQRGDKRAVYAYKIVMNSFYGVLGTPGCRFAASALAGAITTFGQHILYWARDLVTAEGFEVLYGDTDSLFVLSGTGDEVGALSALGARLAALVNNRLSAYTRETYGVTSRIEIEFEGIYRRWFLPPMRTPGDDPDDETEVRGRAKGYAGLVVAPGPQGSVTEYLEVKGMEAVRHDWTVLAQELQREMLTLAFHDATGDMIGDRVRTVLRELRAGRRDELLVYRKSLRKPVEAYTKSSPPHARAAALLPPEERTGLIRYVWTLDGPQPEERRTAPLDYEHYVQKQVRPVVESLAPYVGLATESMFAAGGQLGLF